MKKKPILYWVSVVLCSLGLLVSSGMFLRQWMERRSAESSYQTLTDKMITPAGIPGGRR